MFSGVGLPSQQQLLLYDNLTLLGPPKMRGAIVFSGSSHPTLVDGICDRLGMKRGTAQLSKFANGETSVHIRRSSQLWPCSGADGV